MDMACILSTVIVVEMAIYRCDCFKIYMPVAFYTVTS